MDEESILLSIEFNSDDIKANIKNITDARKQIDNLLEANKKLAEQGKKNSAEYVTNQQAIKALNTEVAQSSKIIQANTQAVQANANSIEDLKKRHSELLKERNKISTSTEEGRKKIEQLNAKYDENSKIIAANSTQVEKQRFNIGNYQSALSGVSPQLGQFTNIIGDSTGKLTSAAKATEGMSLATKLLLGPIGLLILAGTAIINFLTGSEEGMDKLEKITAKVGAVLSVLKGTLISVGSALVSFASGDFSKGVDTLSDSFSGLGDRMSEPAKEAGELADIFDTLDELRLRNKVSNDEEANQVKNLIIQSKNRNLTEQQRNDLLKEAAELEKKITGGKIALQVADLNASTKQFLIDSDRLDLEQRLGETTIDFAKRIIKEDSLLLKGRQDLADKLGEYNGLLDNQANIQEKIQNQADAIAEKAEADAQKRADADKKRLDENAAKQEEIKQREISAANELEILKLEREARLIQGAENQADKLIEVEQVRAEQLLANKDLTEQERQLIVFNSEEAINRILLDSQDKQKAEQQAMLAQSLEDYKVYVQGLIDEKKRELLEGKITREEYNQEIADLDLAAAEVQFAIKEEFGIKDIDLASQISDKKIAIAQNEADAEIKIKQLVENAKINAVKNGLGQIASAFNKQSVAYKALASAQTLIDTIQGSIGVFFGMTDVIPGPVGVILGIAAAAAATIRGLAAVDKINSTQVPKLAEGGVIDIGGKRHSQGGEKVSIGGRAVAEVEGGESMVVLKRGASPLLKALGRINEMSGGVNFANDHAPRRYLADGGLVSRSAAAGLSNDFGTQLRSLSQDIQKLRIQVEVSEIRRVENNVKRAEVTSELS